MVILPALLDIKAVIIPMLEIIVVILLVLDIKAVIIPMLEIIQLVLMNIEIVEVNKADFVNFFCKINF